MPRTTFTYDEAGNQVTAEDPLGNISSTVYDALGHVIAQVDPLNKANGRRNLTRVAIPEFEQT